MRAVSLWGAAAAVGAATGPLLGGLLVDVTGWQGLFWVDAVVAAACIVLTASRLGVADPDRPRSIDFAGTVLVALTLMPLILAREQGRRLGLVLGRDHRLLAVAIAAGFGFVPSNVGWLSRCSTCSCCATGCWSGPPSRS